jgi:hypothetical protein
MEDTAVCRFWIIQLVKECGLPSPRVDRAGATVRDRT